MEGGGAAVWALHTTQRRPSCLDQAYRPRPDAALQVDLCAAEVEASCVRLNDGVLGQPWSWQKA